MHPYQLYHKLLDGKTDFLTVALHAKLAKKNSPEGLEMFQEAFESMAEECEQVAVDDLPDGVTRQEMQVQIARITELMKHGV